MDVRTPRTAKAKDEGAHQEGSDHKPKATRRYAPKVRTGCITCKVRRKKCDEEKPACRRCTKGGWKCDGYAPVTKVVSKGPRGTASPGSSSSDLVVLSRRSSPASDHGPALVLPLLPKLPATADPLEHQSLGHFFTHALGDIDRSPGISGFWLRTLPALTQHDALVRHAVTALGATHWLFVGRSALAPKDAARCDVFATRQLTHAISHLVPLMSRPRPEDTLSVLICCLLFVYADLLKGSQAGALRHLISGCRLLASLSDVPPSLEGTVREVATLFRGLGASVNMFLEERLLPNLMTFADDDAAGAGDEPARPFGSLDEAAQALALLDLVMSDLHSTDGLREALDAQQLREAEQADEAAWTVIQERFRRWEARFDRTVETLRPARGYLLLDLQLQRRLWRHMVGDPYDALPSFAADECSSLMDEAERLLAMTSPTQRVFTPATNLVPLMLMLYSACTDMGTRERAIRLLRMRHRREAVWDSEQAADFLQADLDRCVAGEKECDWPDIGPTSMNGALLVFRPKP